MVLFFKKIIFALFLILSCFSLQAQNTRSKDKKLPDNWQLLSPSDDGYFGIEAERAHRYLDSLGIRPVKVCVAVIDADLDTGHEDLKARIWVNPRPGKMGYSGDVHGWNFLGAPDGRIVTKAGTEAFREYKRLRRRYESISPSILKDNKSREEYQYFLSVRKEAKINSYIKFGEYLKQVADAYRTTDSLVQLQTWGADAKLSDLNKIQVQDSSASKLFQGVQAGLWRYDSDTPWKAVYAKQIDESEVALSRIKSLDDPAGPRDLIGDKYLIKDKYYGNAVLFDSTSFHGTFVAGIIGAVRNNGIGINGVVDSVSLMGIRAVPDGDEYDKDVALAIRYAVDNGARIINMSFGKYLSPDHKWVDEAVEYAAKKGVLMVHAAGNDGRNVDSIQIYPTGLVSKGQRSSCFIRVGASDYEGRQAKISNYGKRNVDVFAPGMRIRSTTPSGYTIADGTSLAAPVVSGLAALIWSYFPDLTVVELREVLKQSVTPVSPLKEFCEWGGIVNAYKAVKKAQHISKIK